jgi:hypothetical protein
MSEDYLRYEFNQKITPDLRKLLNSKDLSNMVITVHIGFPAEKIEEPEEEKEAMRRNERRQRRDKFRLEWGRLSRGIRKRTIRKYRSEDDEFAVNLPKDLIHKEIMKHRRELYDKYFPGEKEDDFLMN